jgi:signal peptidase II
VVLADQCVKGVVSSALDPGEHVHLLFGFQIVRVSNPGVAFGALGGGGALVLAVTLAALAAVLVWFTLDPARPWLWLGVGLLAGGALGNLADRARAGAVLDFIDPPAWPAFNVADVAITLGAVVLVLATMREEPRARGGGGT